MNSARAARLVGELSALIADDSGLELEGMPADTSFLDLGLDSLFMTQFALTLQGKFGVKVTFRQLLGEISSVAALAAFLDGKMPAEAQAAPPSAAGSAAQPAAAQAGQTGSQAAQPGQAGASETSRPPVFAGGGAMQALSASFASGPAAAAGTVQAVIDQQLKLMAAQLELLAGSRQLSAARPAAPATTGAATTGAATTVAASTGAATTAAAESPSSASGAASSNGTAAAAVPPVAAVHAAPPTTGGRVSDAAGRAAAPEDEAHSTYDVKKAFGAIARIHKTSDHSLTPLQQARLDAFIRRYTARTRGSKEWTQKHRANMADPRVVSGFKPALKEMVYPIVVTRSAGAHLWDLDGNQYVDTLNGFGSNFFGYQPKYIADAVKEQVDRGYEVGPQTPLAGEAADLVCELTGFDRAGFCNTGSEAVLGCMRVARTVTGRRLIAMFSGAYHGIFDEVLVRGTKKLKSVPAAPGVMPSTVENILVLDYGTPETLEILKARAHELAAVLVEPIQSRRPDFQPKEFLHEVRKLTQQSGTALIFDEVITGFRLALGGAQAHFGIRADLASYGKVAGGGVSIGIVAGKKEWMDALDGGTWQFGDDSGPTVGVTYFAGTFVRHPLAMAACVAGLKYLKKEGPGLQERLSERSAAMVGILNDHFKEVGAPLELRGFASLWKPFWTSEQPWGELLFALMRDRGVHIWDGFPNFLTLAHTDEDLAWIVRAFEESVAELQDGGFLPERKKVGNAPLDANAPPVPGARLGRDEGGLPAWYVPDPDQPGKYVKLGAHA